MKLHDYIIAIVGTSISISILVITYCIWTEASTDNVIKKSNNVHRVEEYVLANGE